MKLSRLWIALGLPALLPAASAGAVFEPVRGADAARAATTLGASYDSRIAMWIWSDKYVYQPGERLTLRWTVKTNGDRYPYTIVAYRQNNQNGRISYVPAGTEAPTDVFGNTPEQGFQPTRLGDTVKTVSYTHLTLPTN